MNHFLKNLIILGIGIILAWPTLAQDNSYSGTIAQRFSDFDADSKIKINHQPLSDMLAASVFPIGRSTRFLGNQQAQSYSGSRIKTSKPLSPSRYEGNRILFHAFTEDHKAFFQGYQLGLEHLSNRRSLSELNKKEQMAYWLNLYNVIVINKLIEEYPISNTKSLRGGSRGKNSFWNEKVTTVEGVPLSLNDIEKILYTNFNKPELAFGLWQGNVGGPRLQTFAYTANNLDRALEINAVEFVNSNRGLRPPTGSRMKVSDFYEMMMPFFGRSETQVLMFIKEYADPGFVSGVGSVSDISFKIYDWTIADLTAGSQHTGQHLQMGGVLNANGTFGGGFFTQEGDFLVGRGIGITGNSNFVGKRFTYGGNETQRAQINALGNYNQILQKVPGGALEGLPDQTLDLLFGVRQNSSTPITIITSEECAPGDACVIERVDGPQA